MEKFEPKISFEEIFEDRIVLAELEALYYNIINVMNGATDNGEVDDWECIVADRIATLVSGKDHLTRKYARPIRGTPMNAEEINNMLTQLGIKEIISVTTEECSETCHIDTPCPNGMDCEHI